MDSVEATRLDDMFRRSIYEEGIEKGRNTERNNIIKKMISNNLSCEDISKITGKSLNEINSIINKIV